MTALLIDKRDVIWPIGLLPAKWITFVKPDDKRGDRLAVPIVTKVVIFASPPMFAKMEPSSYHATLANISMSYELILADLALRCATQVAS